ncbi:acyl-CoA dehydrogenase family protein [Streptomyces sp. NPDC058301]|uniref:acyl-CoA dehydrogenase family protein n=1 Tax=Streptomyces sp. NPDC058301 TaxID=3346436 RepID=UPI0036EB60F4
MPQQPPAAPQSFIEGLASGRLPWELFAAFPQPGPEEGAKAQELLAELGGLVDSRVDGDEVDRTGLWPDGLLQELRERGYFRLLGPDGRGLTRYDLVRAAARADRRSMGVGQMLLVQNGIAAGALLPAIPPGPLHDFLRSRSADGAVSGFGDTDPAGQNNTLPATTATLTEDGAAYVLNGEKLFIANAGIADVIGVSATVTGPGGPRAGVFFLPTDTPGFQVTAPSGFIGVNGLSASFRLTDVRVPAEHALLGDATMRLPMAIALQGSFGRTAFAVAGALAVLANCLEYSAEFVARREIDGRGLAEYDKVQRILAATLADEFAVQSAARWTMLEDGPQDRSFELYVTKNLAAERGWQASDRTVSLLGGEGIETAHSKRLRGAVAHPVERYHRDARTLRVVGNVDFINDHRAGRLLLARHQAGAPAVFPRLCTADTGLSEANRRHLEAASSAFQELRLICRRLVAGHPEPSLLAAREEAVILVGRLATELFGLCAVLGRAAGAGDERAQELAGVYATEARHRVTDLIRRLSAEEEPDAPDYAEISRAWLAAG